MIVCIDSGVFVLLTHPNKAVKPADGEDWLYSLFAKCVYVVSSDICYYEVRRSLWLEAVKKNSFNGLDNLNELRNVSDFLNLDTDGILAASQICVETRKIGKQPADNYNIEVDIIIRAHWQLLKQQYFFTDKKNKPLQTK